MMRAVPELAAAKNQILQPSLFFLHCHVDCSDHQSVDMLRITKTDFMLGWMDIDIDFLGWNREVEEADRIFPLH